MKKYIICFLFLLIIACDKEFTDPTRPNITTVFSTREGVIAAANGLQSRWSLGGQSALYQSIVLSGCTTNEIAYRGGNNNEVELQQGGSFVTTRNSVVTNVWSQCLITKSEAEKVLANLNLLPDPIEKASVKAHASIFKALALGTLAQFYEKAPLTTEVNANFNTRNEVLQEAINTLNSNILTLNQATGIPGSNVLLNTIKYKNTIYALLSRYSLMIGDNTNALAYANLVDLTSKSTFLYDVTTTNPVFSSAVNPTPAIGGRPLNNRFGLPTILAPLATDGRIAFYFTPVTVGTTGFYNYLGFFDTAAKLIPVYLPSEMTLIKAEAYARLNDLPNSTIELNKILQKTMAQDAFGVAANLPAYSGANTQTDLLLEIYRNRCIELYLTGMKLEDTRRFGRSVSPAPAPALYECNRRFLPYPDQERFNNTNTPADPAI